ncbi:MAG: DUF1653 domain-containing protein [Lachnospiraceae bacterium]|nr:DUF1653 domain-containing protein [Lachnospiraceae bacterium]
MRENPKPFEIYKHFKGNQYQILTLAKDSEDGRRMVVYQALYGDYTVYVRELSQFMSPVDKVKYPDVSQEYRFEKLNDPVKASPVGEKDREAAIGLEGALAENDKVMEVHKQESEPSEEEYLDPSVVEFLDADSIDSKLNILAGLHHRITDDMLFTMAVASDIELNKGSTEEKYCELRDCLLVKEKFESNRLR